jgi:hypothetical protein
MSLSAADLERAKAIAASAPELSPGQLDRLRAILAGSVQMARAGGVADVAKDGAADAA